MPGYWRHEISGVLGPAARRFLGREPLTDADILLLRAYLRQWMQTPYRGESVSALRRQIESIETAEDLEHWTQGALEEGIDPF